jgi:hypothetical protein
MPAQDREIHAVGQGGRSQGQRPAAHGTEILHGGRIEGFCRFVEKVDSPARYVY